MTSLIIQTLLLMAIAFILGAVIGCLLRNLFGSAEVDTPAAVVGAGVATGAAAVAAKPAPAPVAPKVPMPPMPTEPVRPVEKAEVAPVPPAPLVSKTPAKPKAAAKPKAKRAAAKKAAPVAAAAGVPDNLKLIRGIGPQNEGRLNNLGVNRFAQIASWTAKDEDHYGDVLAFPGRIQREEWVKQAKVLAEGGTTNFSKRVKSGDVESSMGDATAGDMGKKPAEVLTAARDGKADNLTLIDGVGNAIEKKMFKLGIFHFDQVAKMNAAELTWLGNAIGFPGRPERENWKGEAKVLAAGGTTAHAKKVEKGQIKTSRKS